MYITLSELIQLLMLLLAFATLLLAILGKKK